MQEAYNPEIQVVREELDELHGRLIALMVEFPQFKLMKITRDLANEKDQPNTLHLKLAIEGLYSLNHLFEKLLKDKDYSNTHKSIKPCYVLVTNLLCAA